MSIQPATTDLFDTDRYPLHRPQSNGYAASVAEARAGLGQRNCACLEHFIRPDVLARMQAEAQSVAGEATFTRKHLNPYLQEAPQAFPEGHPRNRFRPRVHGMVRADRFESAGVIRSVFDNADLCRFIADCLDIDTLYPYGDPYGSVNVNLQPPDCEFAWHFDHNDFTVSMGLVQPPQGGRFEYAPDIRSAEDENYASVRAVLDGDRGRVFSLVLKPGDLQLFRGGNSLHRVTAPVASRRLSLLLSYVTDPNHIATPDYARRLWGEAHPRHYAAHGENQAKSQGSRGAPGQARSRSLCGS